MLFDLRGKRRRAIQATYLTLALLIGGGLVLFGVGSDLSGGLFDAFRGTGGGNPIERRIERNEARLRTSPRNPELLAALVRDYFQLAAQRTPSNATGGFSPDARDELRKAADYWHRYLDVRRGPVDPALANFAVQIFDVAGLNRPQDAKQAALILAEARRSAADYVRVAYYAALAGDRRTFDLASRQALARARPGERLQVKQSLRVARQALRSR